MQELQATPCRSTQADGEVGADVVVPGNVDVGSLTDITSRHADKSRQRCGSSIEDGGIVGHLQMQACVTLRGNTAAFYQWVAVLFGLHCSNTQVMMYAPAMPPVVCTCLVRTFRHSDAA